MTAARKVKPATPAPAQLTLITGLGEASLQLLQPEPLERDKPEAGGKPPADDLTKSTLPNLFRSMRGARQLRHDLVVVDTGMGRPRRWRPHPVDPTWWFLEPLSPEEEAINGLPSL